LFLSAGINGAAISSWVHNQTDSGLPGIGRGGDKGANVGDQNLAQSAYAIGASLRKDPGLLRNIGGTIRSEICK